MSFPPDTSGQVKVKIEYVFGHNELPWKTGQQFVHPMTGDTMTFSLFKYYVSNIKLKKDDGTWWTQPNSYYLVDAAADNPSYLVLNNVPSGIYTSMEYTMGVDSLMNVTGAHDGALSFTNGMFWDWNSGYIMLKAEGYSPNAPTGTFAMHLGGFSGENNVVTTKTADFGGTTLTVNNSKAGVVKLLANPARLWHSSPGLDSVYVIHSPGSQAKTMAKDFYNNIRFNGIE